MELSCFVLVEMNIEDKSLRTLGVLMYLRR